MYCYCPLLIGEKWPLDHNFYDMIQVFYNRVGSRKNDPQGNILRGSLFVVTPETKIDILLIVQESLERILKQKYVKFRFYFSMNSLLKHWLRLTCQVTSRLISVSTMVHYLLYDFCPKTWIIWAQLMFFLKCIKILMN